ncbi:hypothetical protein DFQ01_103243 [Paenibacillus cellulosilyticus]|uniref:Copper amine oxidase-like protein n=1 Tax=Paenibacillus cellulosilyticus TaxID=375489 RepID=A0A2V2YYI7_9BACL|nr:hypothetical protein [Paenibacillus cellulosilyticus]PWW06341.1 hypothetical protein DFQ01_103243 [Paenibacillus cellulosilyticus]QKS43443.1 hypothetical protein HUB94_02655 [Paenibacillus cellulosilyticus]QKS46307.1 hypothetical protein HUB94_19020 [Paenibacillus cellulosilyticus]
MRKISILLLGVIIGVLISITTSVYGESLRSLVGQKIQGEMKVVLNGQQFDTAIVVNGKSYAPLRNTFESAGYSVSLSEKTVILTESTAGAVETSDVTDSVIDGGVTVDDSNSSLNPYRGYTLKQINELIDSDNDTIAYLEKLISEYPDVEGYKKSLEASKQSLALLLERKAELEAEAAAAAQE